MIPVNACVRRKTMTDTLLEKTPKEILKREDPLAEFASFGARVRQRAPR